MQLKDKVAFVTGAGQGIGACVATAYAREGAKVAVIDMNGEDSETAGRKIQSRQTTGGFLSEERVSKRLAGRVAFITGAASRSVLRKTRS